MNDQQLLTNVRADLVFIRDEWKQSVDDHFIRRGSTTLRRFMDGELPRAWHAAGFSGEPVLDAFVVDDFFTEKRVSDVSYAAVGGAQYEGEHLSAIVVELIDPQDPPPAPSEAPRPRRLTWSQFCDSACMVINGEFIRRVQFVRYVANKLGGAHFDERRGSAERERIYALIDRTEGTYHGRPHHYFMLLAIGQAIAASSDLGRLLE
jgi:hypothetical protein